MKVSKIIHRNETRIRVDFPYNNEMVSKLRQIPDAKWSKTFAAWHIPYTKEAYEQLKGLFPDLELIHATSSLTEKSEIPHTNQFVAKKVENRPLPNKTIDEKVDEKPLIENKIETNEPTKFAVKSK